MTIIAKPLRWGPLAIVVIVLALAVQLAVQWRRPHPPVPAVEPGLATQDTAATDPGATDRLVSRALGQIPAPRIDSTEIKTGWREDVRGIELTAFTPKQRDVFLRMANAEACTCGCGFTLAACRENDLTCPVSLPRVESLRDSVMAGLIQEAPARRSASSPGRRRSR